ncbi:MAG: metallophosphoesterase family protein [Verrucomicrobiota bacterium]
MRIGVLADSHDHLPKKVAEAFADVDEIWHLGDVCSSAILAHFDNIPVLVVRGNCDSEAWPLSLKLEREGMRFLLMHVEPMEIPEDVNVILHGHTHVPRDETIQGVRILNPGAVSKPRHGTTSSVALLEIENGTVKHWHSIKL